MSKFSTIIVLLGMLLFLQGSFTNGVTAMNAGVKKLLSFHHIHNAGDSTKPPWQQIELTGYQMKPGVALTVEADKSGLPLWVPIAGGGVVAGAITYLVLRDEPAGTDPQQLVINDDQYSVPCGVSIILEVLENDIGEGLTIIQVSSTVGDVEILGGSMLQLEALSVEVASLTYVVRDKNGNTGEGSVSVTVDFLILEAVEDHYETDFETSLELNVLANDIGEELLLVEHTLPQAGQLTVLGNGRFTYLPDMGFTGQDHFEYTIEDHCGQQKTAVVHILVNEEECDFEIDVGTQASDCGLANGSAEISVTPDGNYLYRWPDDVNSAQRADLQGGIYIVEIVHENGCTQTVEIEIDELPANYNITTEVDPANCTGGGEIILSTQSDAEGPLVIIVNGPSDTQTFETEINQEVSLSSWLNIVPGTYTIRIYDKEAGEGCSEDLMVEIMDDTPELFTENDSFTTTFQTPIDGNVLTNDSGLSIRLVDAYDISGGTLEFEENGQFTFTPAEDFTGEASFEYTAEDACGNAQTAIVIIEVLEAECDFTAEFMVAKASCGIADGGVVLQVEPMGNYNYVWSNGANTPEISDLESGTYSVTVEDLGRHCMLAFEVFIGENPAHYILDTNIYQSQCGEEGDIVLLLGSPVGGPFFIEVSHPNGTNQYVQNNEGEFSLSSRMEVVPGQYSIIVRNLNLPSSCQERLNVTMMASAPPTLFVESFTPPSSETSNDGEIILVITEPGTAPYDIIVNGELAGQSFSAMFTLIELSAGIYEISIINAEGCISNTVIVELFPDNLHLLEFSTRQAAALPRTLFSDPGHSAWHVPTLPTLGVQWQVGSTPFPAFVKLQIGNLTIPGTLTFQQFSATAGWEHPLSIGKLHLIPRMGLTTNLSNWNFHVEQQSSIEMYPNFETDIVMPLSKGFHFFSRSSLWKLDKAEWHVQFGIKIQ